MGLLASAPPEEQQGEPSVDERRALIDRIASSEQFRRSARLRAFLLYVGGQSLKDGCREIHEQEIGIKVFGRSVTYDRSQDNIVRVTASDLRKRIELYFASEGAHERLLLDIPRGGYKPVFHQRSAPAQSEERLFATDPAPPNPVVALPAPQRRVYFVHLAWGTVCLALGLAWFFQLQQDRAMRKSLNVWEGKPAVAELWRDFVKPSRQTEIVLPDASLSIREELTGKPVALPDYINRQYVNDTVSLPVSKDRRDDLIDIYSHNLVAFGDFRAAQEILALGPVGSTLHLSLARFFQPESIKRDNVILIGGKRRTRGSTSSMTRSTSASITMTRGELDTLPTAIRVRGRPPLMREPPDIRTGSSAIVWLLISRTQAIPAALLF